MTASTIPNITTPQNQDELMQAEIKKRLHGEALPIENFLRGIPLDFDTVIDSFGISRSDLDSLRDWLRYPNWIR